jgi:hypothetical protein
MMSNENLPAPPIQPNTDLRDFPFTPMYRARLFGSSFHARVSDAGWRAGVTLWLKSWDQSPAGSLPDDDIDLCRLAELGRDLKSWRKVKAEALWGWHKCSDGLLYHDVVAEGVNEAWQRKLEQQWRTACARIKKANQRNHTDFPVPTFEEWMSPGQATDVPRDTPVMSLGTDTSCPQVVPEETPSNRQGQGQGQGDSEEVVVVDAGTPAPSKNADPAIAVIEAFDKARACAHGEQLRRPWPQARDLALATAWMNAGATAETLAPLFADHCHRKAAAGEEPIDGLAYFQKIVPKFLADITKPMPSPSENSYGSKSRFSPSKPSFAEQQADNRRAVLAALGGDLEPVGGNADRFDG